MAGEGMHIRDPLHLAGGGGRATHATAERDAHAGGLALERPEHQFAVAHEVETRPVHHVQCLVNQRGEVREIGQCVFLIGDQRVRLGEQQGVVGGVSHRRAPVGHAQSSLRHR